MDFKALFVFLMVACVSSVSVATTVTEEEDVDTEEGKVHEVIQTDPECKLEINNSTRPSGETDTVIKDYVAGLLVTTSDADDAVCYVRGMTQMERDAQQACLGKLEESEIDPSENVAENFEALETSTISLQELHATSQRFCQGKQLVQLVPEGSQVDEHGRKKRAVCPRYRCNYWKVCGKPIYCSKITWKCYRLCRTYYYNCRKIC